MQTPPYLNHIIESERHLKIADHLLYMTYSLVKDKKLLLKILSEINTSILNCINGILQYEYLYKRITLTKDARTNFRIFINKCSKKYQIEKKEIELITELISIAEKHRKSPMEFVRNDKIIILSESSDGSPGLQQSTITAEKIKEFLETSKLVLKKTKSGILNQ